MRLTKQQRADLELHRKALQASRRNLLSAAGVFRHNIDAVTQELNAHVVTHNAAVIAASAFVEGVADSLREEIDERSDRWKEGDAGQAAQAMLDEWERAESALEALSEVQVLMPDMPELGGDGYVLELPEEPNG